MRCSLSLTAVGLILAGCLFSTVQAQGSCNEGDLCTYTDVNGDDQQGFCNDSQECGAIGSKCTAESQCFVGGFSSNACSSGVCGGVGATCAFDGGCTAPQFCASDLGLCQQTCPDNSAPAPQPPYCSCPAGQAFSQSANKCGCNPGFFANPPGSQTCVACPDGANSDAASDVCRCPNTQAFSVTQEGTGVCCPLESTANGKPSNGGAKCKCNDSQQTYNADTVTCDCPADTFGNYIFGAKVSKVCYFCPEGQTSVAGTNDACVCKPDLQTTYDFNGNLICAMCPTGSVYDEDQGTCRCNLAEQYFDYSINLCGRCPPPLNTVNPSDHTQCSCPGPNELFNIDTGLCECIPGADCGPCLGGGVVTYLSYIQTNKCICGNMEVYIEGAGCFECPPHSFQAYQAYGEVCFCQDDPHTNWNPATNECECHGHYYTNPLDPGTCLRCGPGTDSHLSTGGDTCVCKNPEDTFDQTTGECGNGLSPSARARSKNRGKRAQMLLEGWRNAAGWKELSSDILCPDGEQACPVLPSMISHECINTNIEIDSCGGCRSLDEGVDCLSIPGTLSATCQDGECRVISCLPGYSRLESNGIRTCLKKRGSVSV